MHGSLSRAKYFLVLLTISLAFPILSTSLPHAQGQVVGTVITKLKASSTVVFAGVNFTVSGLLETMTGNVLSFKNITITCAHKSFLTMTDSFGVFRSAVWFPPGSPTGSANVTVTYVPYAYSQDVQMYLISSASVPVLVEYRQSVLSAKLLPLRTPFGTPKPIDFAGNARIDTAQFKFGTGSLALVSSSDEISTPASSDFAFGAGDFTFDMWVKFSALPQTGNSVVFWQEWQDPENVMIAGLANISDTQEATFYSRIGGPSAHFTSGPVSVSSGVWYHVAWTRSNGTLSIYWDGVDVANIWDTDVIPQLNATLQFGSYPQFYGWIDEVRVSNVARWTSNFAPPTVAYTRDSNTVLLLHFDDPSEATSTSDDVSTVSQSGNYLNNSTLTASHPAAVIGNLTGQELTALAFRNITISQDGNLLGKTTTTGTGTFAFPFILPATEGAHRLTVTFPAVNDTYSPSEDTLSFNIAPLSVTSSTTISTTSNEISETTGQSLFPSDVVMIMSVIATLLALTVGYWFVRKKRGTISEINRPTSTEASVSRYIVASDVPCEYCKTLIPVGSKYCDHCGKPNQFSRT